MDKRITKYGKDFAIKAPNGFSLGEYLKEQGYPSLAKLLKPLDKTQ